MSYIKDGGSAFPVVGLSQRNEQAIEFVHERGMTLRDYFAAKAMQACTSDTNQFLNMSHSANELKIKVEDAISAYSYAIADAMLKARG